MLAFVEELEDYIKDYITSGDTKDIYLNQYIALVLEAQSSGAPIFSEGLLDRPKIFSRYVTRYIIEGYQERAAIAAPPV